MRINHNISAVITNKQLLGTENNLTKSMERLSSGYKLNHAHDDPSGMAISNKMKAQIDGLDRATQNASDGMSVLETADGALNEVNSILQRMRELSVQAANDTNSDSDRDKIQTEIDELTKEIDRIASSAEFNTKSLLDGSQDAHIYADHISRKYASDGVEEGVYDITVTTAATQASLDTGKTIGDIAPITADTAGIVEINGARVTLSEGMTADEIYEALRTGAERGDVTLEDPSDPVGNTPLKFTSVYYGTDARVEISVSNEDLASALGLQASPDTNIAAGTDAKLTLDKTDSAFKDHPQATVKYDGNKMTITDVGGFEMSFLVEADFTGDISMEVTDVGTMDIQVGANTQQQIGVRIPSVGVDELYLDKLNVRTYGTASKAIATLDDALERVNTVRSAIGAYSNRMEYAISNLEATSENMNSAISRIKDVDMAGEMTEYTKYNVLSQAGTSALAQANEIPQMALQLLQ